MAEGEEENERPAKKKGRPLKTVDEVMCTICPDGMWLCDNAKTLAIYVCHFCYDGRAPQMNLHQDIRGRLIAPPGDIMSKVNVHIRLKSHLEKKLGTETRPQLTLEASLSSAADLSKQAAETVLDFARFALTTGNSFGMFDTPAASYLVRRSPVLAKEIQSLTHCSGALPKAEAFRQTFGPAAFAIHLTMLRELVTGRLFSLIADESPDTKGRPLVNVILQLHHDDKIVSFLAASKRITKEYDESVNQRTMRMVLDLTLNRLGARWTQVMAFVSDSASYNIAMMSTLNKKPDKGHVIHVRCAAHLLHDAVTAALKNSSHLKLAAELATNLSVVLRKSRALKTIWAKMVNTLQTKTDVKEPPRYYKTRWYALVSVVEFTFEYLTASLAFIRKNLMGDDLSRAALRLKELCSGGSDFDILEEFTGRCQLLLEELTRLALFLDSAQKKMATFGSILVAITGLQDDLGVSPAPNCSEAVRPGAAMDWRRLPERMVQEFMADVKDFRSAVQTNFRELLEKHFYADGRILPLAQTAQRLNPKCPLARTATWRDIWFAAAWWSKIKGPPGPEKLLGDLKSQFELFQKQPAVIGELKDGLHFWHQQSVGTFKDLAAFALDVLSIPIGSAEVERSFSRQHRTDTKLSTNSRPGFSELKAMLYQNSQLEFSEQFSSVRRLASETWFQQAFNGRILRAPTVAILEQGLVRLDEDAAVGAVELFDDTDDEPVVDADEADDAVTF
jgi:hypothetical protein